jgi:hypothetical protein
MLEEELVGTVVRKGDYVLNIEHRGGMVLIRRYRYTGSHHKMMAGSGSLVIFDDDLPLIMAHLTKRALDAAKRAEKLGSGSGKGLNDPPRQ